MVRYIEDGLVMGVDVLANNSDDEWERYELRVTEIIRENGIYKPPQIGSAFECPRRKDVFGIWSLVQ